jgi:hypothetical protein
MFSLKKMLKDKALSLALTFPGVDVGVHIEGKKKMTPDLILLFGRREVVRLTWKMKFGEKTLWHFYLYREKHLLLTTRLLTSLEKLNLDLKTRIKAKENLEEVTFNLNFNIPIADIRTFPLMKLSLQNGRRPFLKTGMGIGCGIFLFYEEISSPLSSIKKRHAKQKILIRRKKLTLSAERDLWYSHSSWRVELGIRMNASLGDGNLCPF